MYRVILHRRCNKFLQKIDNKETKKIIEKIRLLQNNPLAPGLNIKRLVNTDRSFRLRTGNIRVIYEVDTSKKAIYIHNIDFRGNVY